jgi:pimeloyl-ACP methyl ester carboxylesterase
LSQRFHVFAVDKLGSGMTGNPPDDKSYNLEGEVEHMYQFLLAMKLGKAHLVGQARGGSLVLFLAAQHADVVASITIINSTNAAPPVGETGRGAALSACPTGRTVEEWKCRLRFTSTAPDVTFDEEFWEAGTFMSDLPKSKEATQKIANGAGEPLNGRFPQTLEALHSRIRAGSAVQMPVFLYWGVEDPNNVPGFPPAKAGLALYDIVAAENPRARMLLANRSGHCHFREHPEEFNANLTNFIVNVASK